MAIVDSDVRVSLAQINVLSQTQQQFCGRSAFLSSQTGYHVNWECYWSLEAIVSQIMATNKLSVTGLGI